MSNSRPWVVGAAAVSALLVLAGWFLLISPERGKASSLRAQTVQQDQKNQSLQLDIQQLEAQNKTLPAKQAELAQIKRQMPNNPGLPTLVRTLTTFAQSSGAVLKTVTPGTPAAFTPGQSSSTTASSAASNGLVAIPVTVTIDGTYAQNELFLQKLQNAMTRVIWVSGITINPFAGTGSASADQSYSQNPTPLEMSISGSIFVLQDAPATGTASTGTTAAAAGATSSTGSAS